jgi:hypothetical protein
MMVLGSAGVFVQKYIDDPVTKELKGLAQRIMQ